MAKDPQPEGGARAKRTAKDSVFIDLFRDKKNLLDLYKALHPEDKGAMEDDLDIVTIENVLTDNIYNDLGFMAHGDRLLVLVEAQSTWSVNILMRILMYLAQTYHEYFVRTKQDLYRSGKVRVPRPELYVVYTGERGGRPDEISLSEEFFGGGDVDIEVRARIIYEGGRDGIIDEYIQFCKIFNEQTRLYGMTREAVERTIQICKDRGVLGEYLEKREKEARTIMMSLFDDEQIIETYAENRAMDAAREAAEKAAEVATKKARSEADKEMAESLIRMGKLSIEEIATCVHSLTLEDLQEMKANAMQLA